jgi:late competence protein required for DNA uptake (superfamily II DNA/RNA helicase)
VFVMTNFNFNLIKLNTFGRCEQCVQMHSKEPMKLFYSKIVCPFCLIIKISNFCVIKYAYTIVPWH